MASTDIDRRNSKALSALRAAHPALADGAQIHRYASSNAGVFALSRIDKDKRVEYVAKPGAIVVLLAILLTMNAFAIWLRNRYGKRW